MTHRGLTGTTLASFDPKRNGITATRLGLALLVIVSHAYRIGAFGPEPLVRESQNTISLGSVAVLGFFTLSGFLLAASRERTPVLPFLRNRALRILPGYWLSLLFVALVAGPIAASMNHVRLDAGESVISLLPRLVFLSGPETQLQAAFDSGSINGSLWTLGVEILCYVCLAMIPARLLRPVVAGELVLLTVLWAAVPDMRGAETALMLAFALGAVAWCLRARIPISSAGVALAAVVALLGLVNGVQPVITLGVGYLALALAWLPIHLERDLSYGVYVLAYPTQMVLAMTGVRSFGAPVFIAVAIALVLPLAFLSWTFIERPALGLRRRFSRAASPAIATPPPQPARVPG